MPKTQAAVEGGVGAARIAAWQAIAVAIITAVGGYAVAVATARSGRAQPPDAHVVPVPTNQKTVTELGEANAEGVTLLRDVSVFDLRSWRRVLPEAENTRFSPVNYINYLHLRKTAPITTWRAHYSTSGHAIDLRCVTHSASILRRDTPVEHRGDKEYAVEVDIRDVPVGVEFLVVIEGTYWNNFQSPGEQTASTYTDRDIGSLGELGLIVLLPPEKPVRSHSLWTASNEGGSSTPYRLPSAFFADPKGQYLYWNISTRSVNRHYTIRWTW